MSGQKYFLGPLVNEEIQHVSVGRLLVLITDF